MGVLTEDFDLSPIVPIDSNELNNLRMGLMNMMKYAEGHAGSFQISVLGDYEDDYGVSARRNILFTICPDDIFETVDANYNIWGTVWCPADTINIMSWLESALYNFNKDYINPYHRFVISSVHYGKYQMLFQ